MMCLLFSIETLEKLATIFFYCPVTVGFSQCWDVLYGLPVLADPSGFGPFLMSLGVASLNSSGPVFIWHPVEKKNGHLRDIVLILNTPKLFIEMVRNLYVPLFLQKNAGFYRGFWKNSMEFLNFDDPPFQKLGDNMKL